MCVCFNARKRNDDYVFADVVTMFVVVIVLQYAFESAVCKLC